MDEDPACYTALAFCPPTNDGHHDDPCDKDAHDDGQDRPNDPKQCQDDDQSKKGKSETSKPALTSSVVDKVLSELFD